MVRACNDSLSVSAKDLSLFAPVSDMVFSCESTADTAREEWRVLSNNVMARLIYTTERGLCCFGLEQVPLSCTGGAAQCYPVES